MERLSSLFIAIASLLWFAPGQALAAETWHATQVAGEVRVEIAGAPAVRLTVTMAIASDALIETAASGTATLMRGDDRVIVAPNSRLRLPADDASGFTRIIEQFGELFFQVSKRTQPHFRVEAPLLAATVKGTSFTVSVDDKGTRVQVREGLVLVQNKASADKTFVGAGRIASVVANMPLDLHLDSNIVPPSSLRLGDGNSEYRPELAAPARLLGAVLAQRRGDELNLAAGAQIAFAIPARQRHRGPASMVIDSTLSGLGVGILAAALAIIFIGTNRRRPGFVDAKSRRADGSKST